MKLGKSSSQRKLGAIAAVFTVIGTLFGAASVHFDTLGYHHAKTAFQNLVSGYSEFSGTALKYETTFVDLNATFLAVPTTRNGAGGGLTELENKLLLLTHDGQFYFGNETDGVERLNFEPPQNGFADYLTDAETKFTALNHKPDFFRFNDILAIKRGNQTNLFASFTRYFKAESCYVNAIARTKINLNEVRATRIEESDWETVFESTPCLPLKEKGFALEGHTAGGRITFDGEKTLFLGSGDYHWDGDKHDGPLVSQLENYEYGKVIAIDIDTGADSIVSIGNRNMQGIAYHNGNLYTVEHGLRGGDELNAIELGANFGWPLETLGTGYNLLPFPGTENNLGRHELYERPVFAWLPSVAISSLNVIDDFHPAWQGDLIMGGLSSKSLFRLRIIEDRLLFSEQIEIGERVRYAQQIGDKIVLWTDSNKLVFLSVDPRPTTDPVADAIDQLNLEASAAQSLTSIFGACRECHSVNLGNNLNAPTLYAIQNRAIGSTNYTGYSANLLNQKGNWTQEALRAFLSDPQTFAQDSTMPSPDLSDENLERVLQLLEKL